MIVSRKKILLTVVGVTLVLWAIVFVRHQSRKSELAHSELKAVAPELAEKLDRQVSRLKRESLEESLTKLSDVNMFYWPGPSSSGAGFVVREFIPLGKEVGQLDLEAIMSNRRFCKTFDELGRMEKAAASSVVNRHLSAGIDEYVKLYDAEIQRVSPGFKLDKLPKQKIMAGPAFAINNVREGKVVIAGARLKILSLVWTSGMLGLTGSKVQVERVARLALKQRTELYADSTLHSFFKHEMLGKASLYNRQIISTGLLGVAAKGEVQGSILKAIGSEWQERRLPLYKGALTEFDLPVRSGVMNADYSSGSITVKSTSPMDDASFDMLLHEIHLIP